VSDQGKITRIERVKFITYYPARTVDGVAKAAGWMIKGDTEGNRVKEWCGKEAMKGVMDRIQKGSTNDWGGTEFTPIGSLGLNVGFKKVTVIEAKGTGSVRERGGKIVTFDSLVELAKKSAAAGMELVSEVTASINSTDAVVKAQKIESAQKWGGSIFIAAVDAGEAHVDPTPAPVQALKDEGFEEFPEALDEEDGEDGLPF
jgi:hypothetical protein